MRSEKLRYAFLSQKAFINEKQISYLNKGIAEQCKPALLTPHSSLLIKKSEGAFS
ncbi:MAG: hypothetical protein ACP5D3_08810 [Sulfurovum sp.]